MNATCHPSGANRRRDQILAFARRARRASMLGTTHRCRARCVCADARDAKRGDTVWLRQKELGIWRDWTWRQIGDAVRESARAWSRSASSRASAPRSCRIPSSNGCSPTSACCAAGGVGNGIYPTDAPPQVEYLLRRLATRCTCSSRTKSNSTRCSRCARGCRSCGKIVVFDMEGLARFSDPQVISLDALRELGRAARGHARAMSSSGASAARGPDDLAILVYTSGTTGRPKGAMHDARATSSTRCAATTRSSRRTRTTSGCAFLPLCHIAERLGGEYFALYTGSKLNFVENPETVPENVREIAPTVFTAVPRVWEKFYSGVTIALQRSEPAAADRPMRWASASASASPTGARGRSRSRRRCALQFRLAACWRWTTCAS